MKKTALLSGVLAVLITAFTLGCGDDGSARGDAVVRYASEFTVVEIDPDASATLQLAVQACAGLNNRELGGSIYIQMEAHDEQWLDELDLEPNDVVNALDFLDACVAEFQSCVRYSYDDQQELLPSILTVAAALDAVPLDVGLTVACGDVAFDATLEFEERNTPYLATKYVFENYIEQTTGLAMLNPGYNLHDSDLSNPELTRDMPSAMVDFVFSQKLFVVFLVNGCVNSNPENELLYDIVNDGHCRPLWACTATTIPGSSVGTCTRLRPDAWILATWGPSPPRRAICPSSPPGGHRFWMRTSSNRTIPRTSNTTRARPM